MRLLIKGQVINLLQDWCIVREDSLDGSLTLATTLRTGDPEAGLVLIERSEHLSSVVV